MTPATGTNDNPSGPRPNASARVLRGTAAYAAGAVLQRAVPFLLLPFFTRILSPSEFGQVGIITTIASGLAVIVGMGLETAVFRGYLLAEQEDGDSARVFVNTVGGFGIVVPLLLAAAFGVFGAPLIAPPFGVPVDAVRLAGAGAGATAAATLVPLSLLRSQERLRDYIQLTALQVVVTPVLIVLLVAVMGWGVTGWMLAYALSSIVLLSRGLTILGHRWSLDLNAVHVRQALAFGIPLVPHALSHWGLAVSDRAILGAFVSAPQVGAYYVAYLFSLPVSLIAIALSQATQPLYAEASAADARRIELGRIMTVQSVLIVLTAAAVALVGPSISILLLPTNYVATATLIPWLAVGSCLFGLYLMPMAAVALVVGRTRRIWIMTVVAATANIGLNLLLVPQFGTIAAAVNTTIGYGLLLLGVFLYMRRVCNPPIPYEASRIAMGMFVVIIPSAVAAAVTTPHSASGLVVRATVIFCVSIFLLAGPFRGEARAVMKVIRTTDAKGPA